MLPLRFLVRVAFVAVAMAAAPVYGASDGKDQTTERVLTLATALGMAEPRVRYCEGGKDKGAADLAVSYARSLVAPHKELSEQFEFELQKNRKIETGMLGLEYMRQMNCAPWGDHLIEAVSRLIEAMAAYERAHPKQ